MVEVGTSCRKLDTMCCGKDEGRANICKMFYHSSIHLGEPYALAGIELGRNRR